ncbi:MAG: hypothetical protein ACOCP8_00040 [archaeon]
MNNYNNNNNLATIIHKKITFFIDIHNSILNGFFSIDDLKQTKDLIFENRYEKYIMIKNDMLKIISLIDTDLKKENIDNEEEIIYLFYEKYYL